MAQISIEPLEVEKEFDGLKYILTKIDYSKEDAEQDKAYHEGRARDSRIVEDGAFWLVYTKVGLK